MGLDNLAQIRGMVVTSVVVSELTHGMGWDTSICLIPGAAVRDSKYASWFRYEVFGVVFCCGDVELVSLMSRMGLGEGLWGDYGK